MEEVTIEDERIELGRDLAEVSGLEAGQIDRSILLQHEKYPAHRRNMVSTLASIAQLTALMKSMSPPDRRSWLDATDNAGVTNRDHLLGGGTSNACAQLSEQLAGHFDVVWDGNWPDEEVRRSLIGRLPDAANPGDILVGGDRGGARIKIRVIATTDGGMTGEVVPGTFREGPATDRWVSTYRRLEAIYPDEVPELT